MLSKTICVAMTPLEVRRDFEADVIAIRELRKESLKEIRKKGIKRQLEWDEVLPLGEIRWWLDVQEGCYTWPSLEEDHQYIALREAYADKIDARLREEAKKISLYQPIEQDVCDACSSVFTTYTHMWPCSKGHCLAAITGWAPHPEFGDVSSESGHCRVFRQDTVRMIWVHRCPSCKGLCVLTDKHHSEMVSLTEVLSF